MKKQDSNVNDFFNNRIVNREFVINYALLWKQLKQVLSQNCTKFHKMYFAAQKLSVRQL